MMVGVQGFEPWTLCSQSRCATGLRYTPKTGPRKWIRTTKASRLFALSRTGRLCQASSTRGLKRGRQEISTLTARTPTKPRHHKEGLQLVFGAVLPCLRPISDGTSATQGLENGGGDRNRTRNLLLAKQSLSQLSYTPTKTQILDRNQ